MGFKDEYGFEEDLGDYGFDGTEHGDKPMMKKNVKHPILENTTPPSVSEGAGVTVTTEEGSVKELN